LAGSGPVFVFRDQKRPGRDLGADYLATIEIGMIADTGAELLASAKSDPRSRPGYAFMGPRSVLLA